MCSQENLRNWILISSQDQNQQISCLFRHIENMNSSVQLLEHDWRLASLLFFFGFNALYSDMFSLPWNKGTFELPRLEDNKGRPRM